MPNYKVTVRLTVEWDDEIEAETAEVAQEMAAVAARYNGSEIHRETIFEELTNDSSRLQSRE